MGARTRSGRGGARITWGRLPATKEIPLGTAIGIIGFVVLLLFAIFFHEFGHYITARWAKVKVSKFFVGFGPTLWSVRRGRQETVLDDEGMPTTRPETEYGVKAFPLGGFVKVVGMSPFEEVPPADEPRAFGSVPAWKRAIVLAAGSVTHFVTAFVMLFVIFALVGLPDPEQPTLEVAAVAQEVGGQASPALEAGIEPGDRITAIDGESVEGFAELRSFARDNPGEEVSLTIERGGATRTVELSLGVEEVDGERFGVIGIFPSGERVRTGPIQAVGRSISTIGDLLVLLVDSAPAAFSPDNLGIGSGEPSQETRGLSLLGAGIIASDLASQGEVAGFLFLFVQINVFIAIFNMLPLPPLDGGHLLVLGIEKLRGKPVNQRVLLPVMAVVFSLIMLLGVLLLFNDIVSPPQLPGQ